MDSPTAHSSEPQQMPDGLERMSPEVEDDGDGDSKIALAQRLRETSVMLELALNNKFVTALNIAKSRANSEMYASLATATLSFLRAAFTLEREDLLAAMDAVNVSCELSSQRKHQTSAASMMMQFIMKPNYKLFTDDECHAELVHAEALLMLSLISFLCDQSIVCLIKGAFRLRSCYQKYKECLYIRDVRDNWQSEEAKMHFDSGVRMGYGTFNVLISYLPRRVLRILEYVGFSGDRSVGLEELDKAVAIQDGMRSLFAALIILTQQSYIEGIFGLGSYEFDKVKQLNDSLLDRFPNSAFFLLFRGRYHQMEGRLNEAIDTFEQAKNAQDDWKQFHSLCHWDMMWCNAVLMNWDQAAHFADQLRKHSKWSEASYTYQHAIFKYAKLIDDERAGLCGSDSEEYATRMGEVVELMKTVPELRIRYAGKTIPAEKFAITRSVKFLKQHNRLTLPALEFLYIWNLFATLSRNQQQAEQILVRINDELEHIERVMEEESIKENDRKSTSLGSEDEDEDAESEKDEDDKNYWIDDLCLALLLKAMCLKHQGKLKEAEQCCATILSHDGDIKRDSFLLPHSAMELALLKLSQKQYQSSKSWVKKAKNNYTGYLLETIVHFRLHAASRQIRLETQDMELGDSCDSHCSSTTGERASVKVS